jgi:hypothetical protein
MRHGIAIPLEYIAKRVTVGSEWINAGDVINIDSVSNCLSSDFADFINFWKHNGCWFFDTPQVILELAQKNCPSRRLASFRIWCNARRET